MYQITGKIRAINAGEYTDKDSGEIKQFKKIQLEGTNKYGKLIFVDVRIAPDDFMMTDQIEKMIDKVVSIPCDVASYSNSAVVTPTLSELPVIVQAVKAA